jgi:uncharacterized protein
MPGETNLNALLRSMHPTLEEGEFVFCSLAPSTAGPLEARARAVFRESEGVTLIFPQEDALAAGLPGEPAWALITLTVHSALEAVGFLAAVTRALAEAGICANAVSAFHHDHLFVPRAARQRALAVLEALSRTGHDDP